ncbi:hypothetical protein QJ854_gp030 [Moumouvirus goulette]|uniref:Uncharacterized protein n=1 Tax=Moumouvirus goulette TaxID=1247379 RepID=M1PY92_9VIRU|nr:hypothetical protein QJ854_gp030 [Moumouvirus goulette]AGF85752.1 hypothetical protein glt_00949 [Moumouvirus goulette]
MYWILNGSPYSDETDEIAGWFNWDIDFYDFPRFRDVQVKKDRPIIKVTTRTGGGNREEYEEHNNYLTTLEGYSGDKDASWDRTYAIFYYSIPERSIDKWREFMKKIET